MPPYPGDTFRTGPTSWVVLEVDGDEALVEDRHTKEVRLCRIEETYDFQQLVWFEQELKIGGKVQWLYPMRHGGWIGLNPTPIPPPPPAEPEEPMGSILSKISDDIDEYVALCKHFGEPVQRSPTSGNPDCYGKHADVLKARRDAPPTRLTKVME